MLKATFVQGRLTKDEFDARVGQALASRTHGDLAAVIADISAVVAGGQPPRTSAQGRTRKPINKVKVIAWGACVICALAVVGVAAAVLISSPYLLLLSGLAFIGASAVAWGAMVEAWVQKRSRGRLTQGPAPGVGSRASQRTRPAAEAEQLPPINHGQQEHAEAVQNSLPRRQRRPISRPPRQWCPRGLPTARRTIAVQLARVMSGQITATGVFQVGCSAALSAAICPIPKLIVRVRADLVPAARTPRAVTITLSRKEICPSWLTAVTASATVAGAACCRAAGTCAFTSRFRSGHSASGWHCCGPGGSGAMSSGASWLESDTDKADQRRLLGKLIDGGAADGEDRDPVDAVDAVIARSVCAQDVRVEVTAADQHDVAVL